MKNEAPVTTGVAGVHSGSQLSCESLGGGREVTTSLGHDSVGFLAEEAAQGTKGEAGAVGGLEAEAGDDGDAQAQGDVALDDLPAAGFDGDPQFEPGACEGALDQRAGRRSEAWEDGGKAL